MSDDRQIRNSKSEIRNAPTAILLAAGKGTRMGGDRAKVLYEAAGQSMIRWVVQACKAAGCERVIVVVGYQADAVRESLADEPGVAFVEQTEQLGTGHAAMMAAPCFEGRPATDVFVLAGDAPLIREQTLAKLLAVHRETQAVATLATAELDDPTGYGRVLRDASGNFDAIVEQKDATDEQRAIREVNPSYYCFRSDRLFDSLAKVSNDNKQGEYYLTDVPGMLKQAGERVSVVDAVPAEDVIGVNTPEQLAVVDEILKNRASGMRV
ncbi:NTP transferase domain-containing protein [Phycisphaerales bacterium AB-hyl4]|uniref:NTP transferase domain-containing protein n=1 Tax=Natronomicrosphaera hydrolytica TaxID=3242702 RepID=A0ABV4U8C5_9BACT